MMTENAKAIEDSWAQTEHWRFEMCAVGQLTINFWQGDSSTLVLPFAPTPKQRTMLSFALAIAREAQKQDHRNMESGTATMQLA